MQTSTRGKNILGLAIFAICIACFTYNLPLAQGASYPDETIKVIVPAGAGGGLDREIRGILPFLKKHLPVPVIIEYMPGAAQRRGHNSLYKSRPDGYTLIITSLPGSVVGELMFKPEHKIYECTPLYAWASMNNTLYTHVDSWKSFDEFVEVARSRKIALGLGSGLGGTPHLQGLLLADGLGFDFKWVPFKSAAPALSALVGKHVEAVICTGKAGRPLVEAGKLRGLVVLGDTPDAALPGVPTRKKLGYKFAVQPLLRGILGPPNLPKDRAKILEDALEKAAKDPEFQEWANKMGLLLVDYHPKEFAEAIDTIYKDVGKILDRLEKTKKKE